MTAAADVVAILDSNYGQLFAKARAIKATIIRDSKAMEHPLETGSTITDHRIILPTKIELSMLLTSEDYSSVYQQIRDCFISGELLIVQTRADSFTSMIIEKMPHDETPELYDGIALALSLKEAFFVQPQFSSVKVARPKDSNTVKQGQKQPVETPPAKSQSVLGSVFK